MAVAVLWLCCDCAVTVVRMVRFFRPDLVFKPWRAETGMCRNKIRFAGKIFSYFSLRDFPFEVKSNTIRTIWGPPRPDTWDA